jgi:hypothetical protein
MAVENIGIRSFEELARLAALLPSNVVGIAACTRNLFELNLVLRLVLGSPEKLSEWLRQKLGDEIDILEGFLILSEQDGPTAASLRDRISEIHGLCRKSGHMPAKPFRITEIAKELGLTEEYEGLYKLYSKFVHPSSWLVNSPKSEVDGQEYVNFFVVHAQLYFIDTQHRVDSWFKLNLPRRTVH